MGGNRAGSSDLLIERTYQVTLEPRHYDELIIAWEDYLAPGDGVGARRTDLAAWERVQTHFDQAHALMRRLGRSNRDSTDLASLVESVPGAGLVITAQGRILAGNRRARSLRGETALDNLDSFLDDPVARAKLDRWMGRAAAGRPPFLFLSCTLGRPPVQTCLFATALATGAVKETTEDVFLLGGTDLDLDPDFAATVSDSYGLSGAEGAIAVALARGRTPGEIASERGASINTVRTQIKSILSKLDLRGTPDLVRLVCSLTANRSVARVLAGPGSSRRHHGPARREGSLTMADGRKLSYLEQGDFNGRPVLFCHNMLYGVGLPEPAIEALAQRGWRLLCPSRPGFGESDFNPDVSGNALVAATCRDYESLLDHLGIRHCIVVGHSAGTIYAQRFAVSRPDRVDGIVYVSHAPHWQESFLELLPPRQRIIARTTRVSPTALSFMVRAGIALIDQGQEDQFIHALHKSIPSDMRALRRPDVLSTVADGLRHTVRQGGTAFCADCPLVLTDWTAEADSLRAPLLMLQGLEDRVVPGVYFEPYVARFGETAIRRVPDAGQYLLYSHWTEMLNALDSLAGDR